MGQAAFKRVLLKMSGEALAGDDGYGINTQRLQQIARDIAEGFELGVEIGVVVGGGNIFRGVAASVKGMDRATSDYMGMLATCINSLALQDAFEKQGLQTRVQSAIEMAQIAERYIRRRAIRHLEKNRIVIFAAGTGNPYFTTDSAATLRAAEINADVIIKATRVDGVYDKDPLKYDDAQKYEEVSYKEVLMEELQVMDSTAITFCRDNRLPIIVFDLTKPGNIARVLRGEKIGTTVREL